jgi:hypothetical protein
MKTTIVLFFGIAAAAASVGCNNRYTLLSVPAVSMTTASMHDGETAAPAGKVEGQYCTGDDPIVSKDDNIGLIDEAIAKAQQKSGAKYLTDVTIQRDSSCVYVDGTAMK